MNYREWIPITIKAFRKTHEMTLRDLSNVTGLSVSYLSDLERGRTLPSLETLDKILIIFGAVLTLGVQEDYTPKDYVWIKVATLNKLAEIVKEITPKAEIK